MSRSLSVGVSCLQIEDVEEEIHHHLSPTYLSTRIKGRKHITINVL